MAFRRPGLHKRQKQRLQVLGLSASAGSGALYAISPQFATLPWIGPALAPAFAGGVLAGGAAWAATHACRTSYPPNDELDIRTATAKEVQIFHDELARYTGSLLVPLEERLAIHACNARCFRAIFHDVDRGRAKSLIGMIIVYPLRRTAWNSMLAGELSGRDIRAGHIVGRWTAASALYISFVCGDDFTTRGFAIRELERIVHESGKTIATRPTTKESMRLVQRWGFKTLTGNPPEIDQICWAEYGELRARVRERQYS